MFSINKTLKDWTLPISMLVGSVYYVIFTQCDWAFPVKPYWVESIPYVLPMTIFPLLLALVLRWMTPRIHEWVCREAKDKSFYLWALCTAVNTAQIIRCIVNSEGPVAILGWIVIIVGFVVCLQFYIGKFIGSQYDDRIAAGQGLV